MKIIIAFILLTVSSISVNAQPHLEMRHNPYIMGKIILKNDSVKNGFIQLESSAFRVRYKETEEQKEKEKIDFKQIERIVLFKASSKDRVFFYKKTDMNKFLKFVELVDSGMYDTYMFSENELSLFYKDVDRSNITDFLSFGRGFQNQPYSSISDIKSNLAKVEKPKYFLDTKELDVLSYIYSDKKLRKKANQLFKKCPELVFKIENKEFKMEDMIEIVRYYNNCGETKEKE